MMKPLAFGVLAIFLCSLLANGSYIFRSDSSEESLSSEEVYSMHSLTEMDSEEFDSDELADNLQESVCNDYVRFDLRRQCGQEGYFRAYGEKYCRAFTSHVIMSQLDLRGQKFVNCTALCLVTEMGEYLKANPKDNCDKIADFGFGSHSRCYLSCGFCEACSHNWKILKQVYDLSDFMSRRALATVLKIIRGCGGPFGTIWACFGF